MSTVLAAVDNSAASRPVIGMATVLAPVLGSTVEAVQVTEDDGDTARACAEGVDVPFRTVRGDPLEQLLSLISSDDVVAAVIGARGLPGGRRPPGHLALAVADGTDKPLLLVPPEARAPERLRRVLVAMEGTASRPRRLKRALQLVADAGLELVVVHVDDKDSIPSFSDQIQHETDAYADAFLARYAGGVHPSRLELRIGEPEEEILKTADSIGADIVAIGWPAGAGPDHGLIAREILRRNHIPTLLVAVGELCD
jgi:nucleotide-binding universal stress UspA family protein